MVWGKLLEEQGSLLMIDLDGGSTSCLSLFLGLFLPLVMVNAVAVMLLLGVWQVSYVLAGAKQKGLCNTLWLPGHWCQYAEGLGK